MKRILLIGATSAIAMACSRFWAAQGAEFFLAARSSEKLSQMAADLRARGAKVHSYVIDVTELIQHQVMLDEAIARLGQIDIAMIAHGTLPDQKRCEQDTDYAMRHFAVNAAAPIALMNRIAQHLELQQYGTLVIIGSVAGDRGRPSNYCYGAAKGAVATFAAGLRARLFKSGVNVLTVKPGFVASPMTDGLELPARLVVRPEQVATGILKAIDRGRSTVYLPAFWWAIMQIIKAIPEPLFKRLSL